MVKLFKKHGILIVSAFFILLIVMIVLVSLVSVNKYKKEVGLRDTQIQTLDASLTNLGDIQPGYVVKKGVRAGEKITSENMEELLQEVDVPVKLGLNIPTTKEDYIGKYFRISLVEGTVLTTDNLLDQKLDNTSRYFDLVIDELPIGLSVGDYVDVRITFPFSQDFIAISHKKVEEINGTTPKLVLGESEIYAYQSMLMDKALYAGTKIYAVKYIDAGAQQTAEVYYPLNKNLAELSSMNPNLLELVKQEMLAKRAQVDNLMGGGLDSGDERDLEKLTSQIGIIRDGITNAMTNSQTELDRRLEAERQAAAIAAAQ